MLKSNIITLLCVFLFGLVTITPVLAAEADQTDPYSKFGLYDSESDMAIDHTIWSEVLGATVIVITPSSRTRASTANIITSLKGKFVLMPPIIVV